MKKSSLFVLILLVVVLFTATAFAAEKPAQSKTRQVTGHVTAVDTETLTVIVKKKEDAVALSVQEKTKIIQCSNTPNITDIKVGDKVTAQYKETTGKNIAKSITIRDE
jgi:Cu/Ag efflux protein CusF